MAQTATLYSDGITKVTDPLWEYDCKACKRSGWNLIYQERCPHCGSKRVKFTNPNIKARPIRR